jgi:hypothetical protein
LFVYFKIFNWLIYLPQVRDCRVQRIWLF